MRDFAYTRAHMDDTGIGFAGIAGAWWLPAIEPFALPAEVADELQHIAQAIFSLFDTVTRLYGTSEGADSGLNALLTHKVPARFHPLVSKAPVLSVRPDFQLQPLPDRPGRYQLVATELESCPSAQGFAHAMQVGYSVRTDLVEMFARFLAGRPLLFAGTHQWSEFLFEQLAFCRALAEVGAQGRVLYDLPLATIAEEVRTGRRWQPPIFGVKTKPADWHADVWQHIQAHDLADFWWPDDTTWPSDVGDAVVFRFGYFDCFTPEKLAHFQQWAANGATLLNPTNFLLDSKVMMTALQLPVVRQQLQAQDARTLAVLDRCIPQTLLLQPAQINRLRQEQAQWVLKFAGFDQGNQAWGGRSLRIGAQHTAAEWRQVLEEFLNLPWPVVAQRSTPSVQTDVAYWNIQGEAHQLRQGTTRLRSFMLREPPGSIQPDASVWVGGSHLTVSGGTWQVSESTDAVQAPIIFCNSLL